MLKVPRFIVNSDSSSVINTTLDTALNSTLNSTYSTDKNEVSDTSSSISNFLNLADIPNFNLKFSTFVITDEESTASEAELVSKICKSIKRDNYSSLNLNQPSFQDILNLTNHLNEVGEVLNSPTYENYLSSIKDQTNFKVLVYFSDQSTSTKVIVSDQIIENINLLQIKTYCLNSIANNPNHKSEFWSILKKVPGSESW